MRDKRAKAQERRRNWRGYGSYAERVFRAPALELLGAAQRQAFEIIEQGDGAVEPCEQVVEVASVARLRAHRAAGLEVGEIEDLPRALFDQDADPVFGGGDGSFEADARFGRRDQVEEAVLIFDRGDNRLEEVARHLLHPPDGVQREEDAQEDEKQPRHGR